MPIYDQSFRHYTGVRETGRTWWPITRETFRPAIKNKFVWLLALGLLIYLVVISIGFFASAKISELAPKHAAEAGRAMRMQKIALFGKDVDLGTVLFSFVQPLFSLLWLMMLALGSGSVSGDLRNNALPLYFSRPLTPARYILGKILGLCLLPFLVMASCILLASIQYMAYFLTPGQSLAAIPYMLAGILYLAIVCVFFSVVMAGFSSMTKTSRVAGICFLLFFVGTQWLANSMHWNSPLRVVSPRHSLNAIGRILLHPDFRQIHSNVDIDTITGFAAVVSVIAYCALFLFILRRNLKVVEVVK